MLNDGGTCPEPDKFYPMTIWTIPIPAVVGAMLTLLYLNLTCMRVSRVAYNICSHLAETEGSGVGKHSLSGYISRSTPKWATYGGWLASLASLAVLIYVGMRFGWLWAVGYAVGDHILKSLELPIVPTVSQAYAMVEKQVETEVPQIRGAVAQYRGDYRHE